MSYCKACGGSVQWVKEGRKWLCYNSGTTTDHWDSCSKRRFDRIKATGEYFEEPDAKGYYTELKSSGIQYTWQTSGIKRGKHKIVECGNCVPAWEVCEKCPNSLRV